MPNYDWREYEARPWRVRYPVEAVGAETWVEVFSDQPGLRGMRRWIDAADRLQRTAAPRQPRVFISHRQADEAEARQVADVAGEVGFEYWLDVEDPELTALTHEQGELDEVTRLAAIASTIEMALLNCTHVLAIMTANTAGSMWVPYEYGRVKRDAIVDGDAACWTLIDPADAVSLAHYLQLGFVAQTIDEVEAWLRAGAVRATGGSISPS